MAGSVSGMAGNILGLAGSISCMADIELDMARSVLNMPSTGSVSAGRERDEYGVG